MTEETDILGIAKYKGWTEGGRQVYGIRGIGKTYDDFYRKWCWTKTVLWNYSDMPWDYNTFTEEDEKELNEKFKEYIYEDDNT